MNLLRQNLVLSVFNSLEGAFFEGEIGRINWTGVLLNRDLDGLQRLRQELDERKRKISEKLKKIEVKQNFIFQGFNGSCVLKYFRRCYSGLLVLTRLILRFGIGCFRLVLPVFCRRVSPQTLLYGNTVLSIIR